MYRIHPPHGVSKGDSGADRRCRSRLRASGERKLGPIVRDLFQGTEEFGYEGVPYDYCQTLGKSHGLIETRECWVITDPGCLMYLGNRERGELRAEVYITAKQTMDWGDSLQSRHYVSSLQAPADRLLKTVRSHWSIETSLH